MLAAVWGAGGVLLARQMAARREADLAASAAAAAARLGEAARVLQREARWLAEDSAVVDGARRGDWATLASGVARLRVLPVPDIVVVFDATGVPLVELPPRVRLPHPPAAPDFVTMAAVEGDAYVLAAAPIAGGDPRAGVVVVGRHLDPPEAGEPGTALVVLDGDHLRAATASPLPESGWSAVRVSGALRVGAATWSARPVGRLGDAESWTLVSDAGFARQRRRLWTALTTSFVVAVLAAGLAASGRRGRPARARDAGRRDRDLEALSAAAQAAGSSDDLVATAARTLEIVCRIARTEAGVVVRHDPAVDGLALLAAHGLSSAELGGAREGPAVTPGVRAAARDGRARVIGLGADAIPDATTRAWVERRGFRTLLALPIPVEGRTWGVMVLLSRERRGAGPQEMTLLQATAHQLGLAVARAEAVSDTNASSRRLETLTRLAQGLTGTLAADEVLPRVVSAARELFGAAIARVWLVEEDGRHLALAADAGGELATLAGVQRMQFGDGLVGTIAATRATLAVEDATSDPRTVRNARLNVRLAAEGLLAFAGAPMLVADRVIGVLAIAVRERHRYSEAELALLRSLANQAAITLDNARRHASLGAVLQINTKIAAMASTDTLLSSIAEEAARLLGVDNAGFRIVDGDELVVAGRAGLAHETMLRERLKIGESFTGQVVAEGRTLMMPIDEASTLVPEHREADRRLGYTHFLGVPLRLGERTIGALAFRAKRPFTPRDAELAEVFAGQAAIAIEHARLVSEASRRRVEAEEMAQLAKRLNESLDLNEVVERTADSVLTLFGVHSSALRLLQADGSLVALAIGGRAREAFEPGHVLPPGEGVLGQAVARGHAVATTDLFADEAMRIPDDVRESLRRVGDASMLAVPLRAKGHTVGALGIATEAGRSFTEQEAVLLQAFADQATLALENARLFSMERARRHQVAALAEIERELAAELDLDRLLRLIVDRASNLFGSLGAIFMVEPGERLVPRGRPEQGDTVAQPQGFGEGVVGITARERRGFIVNDYARSPYALPRFVQAVVRFTMTQPVIVGDRLLGVITMDRTAPDAAPFLPEEHEVLGSFAAQAAIAIENARLYRAAASRATRLRILTRLSHLVTATLDTEQVLSAIAHAAAELMNAAFVAFWLADEAERVLRLRTFSTAVPNETIDVTQLAFGEGVVGAVAVDRRPLNVPDVQADARFAGLAWAHARGLTSAFAAPILEGDTLLGVLLLMASRPFDFAADDEDLLQSFLAQATAAIRNARLYTEARAYADRLRALEEVNRLVSSSLNTEQVLRNLARAIAQFFDAPYVSVWAYDPASQRLHRALTYGDEEFAATLPDELAVGEGAVGWTVLHHEPILWTDVRTDTRFTDAAPLAARGVPWLTAYPIAIGERVLGAFAVSRAASWPVTPETASLMGSLAAQAAVALENARLYSETSRRLTETRALLEVAELLNSTLDPKQLLKRVALKVAQVCRVDRCSLELWDGDRVVPLMSQFADGHRAPELWHHFMTTPPYPPRAVPAHARAITTRRPVVIQDAATTDLIPRDWIDVYGIKAYMVVPLVRQDEVIGVMNLDYCERAQRFDDWQGDLALAIANQIALTLTNTRLYQEAQERLRETTILLRVGRVLSQPDAAGDLMRRVAREVASCFGADMAGAYLLDATRKILTAAAGYHVPKALLPVFMARPIVLERFPRLLAAWQSGRASWSADVTGDERFDREWTHDLPPHSVLLVPTLAHGEAVGALFLVWWRTGRAFDAAEIRIAEGVGAQVGLAMENADLARQTAAKLAETEMLLSASRTLSTTLDLQALVRHFLRAVAHSVDADCVGAWLLAEDGEWLEPLAGYRVPPERLERFRTLRVSLLKHAFYAEAATRKQPIATADAMNDPRLPRHMLEAAPHTSQCFVPIIAKDRLVGGFAVVWWERARQFSASELALMEALANQAGVALDNARLFEENRRRVDELSVLYDMSRAVTGQLDRAALLEAIRAHVARVLDVRNLVIVLRDSDTGELEIALRVIDGALDAHPPARLPSEGVGLAPIVIDTGHPLRTDDYVGECVRRGVDPVPLSAAMGHWLGVPMTAADRVLGVLVLRSRERSFSEADERLLGNIAHLAALALASARLYEDRTRAYGELAAAQDQLVRTEKLRALGEMASGVAHDFNNLLASVLGRAQLLLRRVQEPQLRQWLQVIETAALDGAQTVRRLQEFTRIRRDQPLVPVDVNRVVRDALEITQSRWRDEPLTRAISIELRTEYGEVPPVLGAAAELREAMTNLILNAIDAMPQGGVLTLTTQTDGDHVVVTVADSGVGMPPEVREKIFDPFFTTKGPQGTGLGLSMTYGIVSRHGGTITVDSEPGRGSTFRLALPRAAEAAVLAPPPPASPAAAERALRCLIVDDEAAVRTMLGDILEAAGHTPVLVGDGVEAIKRFTAERFDVVLTDLAMPRITGWDVARAVKQAAPAVPVFLVTGFGVELSPEEQRAHGVDAVLVKPLQMQDILDAVAEIARRR